MSQRNRGRPQKRRGSGSGSGGRKPAAVDLWAAAPDPPPVEPVRITAEPTSMLRSLGSPPLPGQSTVAELYMATVVDRAAGIATALAASAGLLATDDPDED